MEPSPEIKELILQLFDKEENGEVLEFARSLYSNQEGVILIGNNQDQWLSKHNSIIELYGDNPHGGWTMSIIDLQAYREGTVGWAMDRMIVKMAEGQEIPLRHTFVLHWESGMWKIVHTHVSLGTS